MIDRAELLSDLQTLLKRLEADLLQRSESAEVPDVGQTLHLEYERAKKAERTAQNYEDWRNDYLTQAAAAWVFSCVFVRFLEDNTLIDPPKIAGPTGSRQSSVVSGQSEKETDNRQLTTENSLQRARDEHELYFREHPTETDREYLLAVFDELAKLPGTKDVFGEHNPIRELPNWLSGDAAGELLRFFQKIEANTGDLIHDFTDPEWDTRFLGDLYQDLSEAARKKYALLQTPEFVEEFILDRTLEPALEEFGLGESRQSSVVSGQSEEKTENRQLTTENFKIIDPACGSGHFLLGAFPRLLDRWQKQEPGGKIRDLVQKTLDCIHGVDMNPYAIAIARFRLLLMAMKVCGIHRLTDAPGFTMNLVCGDSLRHGTPGGDQLGFGFADPYEHVYHGERGAELKRILRPGSYHAVVGNPPYITPKDRAANEAYRKWSACHMKYSLAVPFMQRIFTLAVPGGYTGQITANSFMKREFGKKLIETFLPKIDLTHVIDTSGAYIPGHGTPTVILFGRNRPPVSGTIRAVMGIRGEPQTPDDPAQGLVWQAILSQVDDPGSQSEFISVSDSERQRFHSHPWSIGGGGAAELKEQLEETSSEMLRKHSESIGFMAITGEDDVFVAPKAFWIRNTIPFRGFGVGDAVRDWQINTDEAVAFMYDGDTAAVDTLDSCGNLANKFWAYRTNLRNRLMFGKLPEESGLTWYEYRFKSDDRFQSPLLIAFGEVATHNHFVLGRGGKVFKQTAPVIKLPVDATLDDHLALLGLLNSSVACFWLKQVCHNKGSTVDQHGARQRTDAFEDFYAFNGTKLKEFPLPEGRPIELARQLDRHAQELADRTPFSVLKESPSGCRGKALAQGRSEWDDTVQQMIALQEELDWECYHLYGLVEGELAVGVLSYALAPAVPNVLQPPPLDVIPRLKSGQRAFEIVMARKMASGELETTWFARHGSTPITELPSDWPADYRELVKRRIELIETDRNIALIEKPEYKRRWNIEPWESQLERALREWLLNRLESYFDFDGRMNDLTQRREGAKGEESPSPLGGFAPLREISMTSIAKLSDVARQDAEFLEVGAVYRDDRAFDVQRLVTELVQGEHVPLLPVLRYKASGLRKRKEWEKTWELQRREDALSDQLSVVSRQLEEETDETKKQQLRVQLDELKTENRKLTTFIPVPPKYKSSDFISTGGARYWALRGKLDVPKERWVSFPHCEGPDGTLVIAWAGYDHLQLARAISAYFVDIQERLGGRDDPRLVPLLAAIIELLPWLKQWHHDLDPDYNQRMDEVFEGFVTEEAKSLGMTIEEIRGWQPPAKGAKRRKRVAKRQRSKGAKGEDK